VVTDPALVPDTPKTEGRSGAGRLWLRLHEPRPAAGCGRGPGE